MARDALELPAGALDVAAGERLLADSGFRTARVGASALWGVKHRFALLGFPLFHASFLVLAAGGFQLYLTRDVVNIGRRRGRRGRLRRGQGGPARPARSAAAVRGWRSSAWSRASRAAARCDLAVTLRRTDLAGPAHVSRVNAPATWGPLSVLVDRVGVAPVLWVQDAAGYTLDRVAVVTSGGTIPTRVPLAGTSLEAASSRSPMGTAFPERGRARDRAGSLRLVEAGRAIFDGALRPGEAVKVGDRLVVLQEVRYWVGLRAVHERGGGLLVGGFLLLVVGILWRMFLYRRDVVLLWQGDPSSSEDVQTSTPAGSATSCARCASCSWPGRPAPREPRP